MNEQPPIDFSKLMPADPEKWSRMELVSLNEALLLSLDIDPDIFQLSWEETLTEYACDEIAPSPSYGLQEIEFLNRRDVLQNSVQASSISIVISQSGVRRVRLIDFVCWADSKEFVLPQWMTRQWLPKRVGRKSGQRPETAIRNAKLLELVSDVIQRNPSLATSKSAIAKAVRHKFNTLAGIKQMDDNTIRNALFNGEHPLVSDELLTQLRKLPRRSTVS